MNSSRQIFKEAGGVYKDAGAKERMWTEQARRMDFVLVCLYYGLAHFWHHVPDSCLTASERIYERDE